VTDLILIYESLTSCLRMNHESRMTTHKWMRQSQSHIATDGQAVSKSWCRAPSGAHDQIYVYYYLTITVLLLWGALADERTGLSFVYAAGLASAVFLGSESLGTRDHTLLSQIWDFHFRRLLRLAGSRWRYSTPPPHAFLRVLSL
jgi:hypothetical protein